jgi:hypothetical protein
MARNVRKCPRPDYLGAIADGKGNLALQDVPDLLFPAVRVQRHCHMAIGQPFQRPELTARILPYSLEGEEGAEMP